MDLKLKKIITDEEFKKEKDCLVTGNPFLILVCTTEAAADNLTGIGNQNESGWLLVFDELT